MNILIFAISFISAFIFALGGVGAAIVLIPVLVMLGVPVNTAKPAGLFYNTVSLTGASINNIKNKRLDFKIGVPIIIASFLFAVIGAYISKYIPGRIILLLFTAFLLFSGLMFLFHKKKNNKERPEYFPCVKLSLTGALSGLLSGILGVGGGGVISPLMLLMGFNPKKTAVITAFVVPFSSFSGFMTYMLMGSINWKITLIASAGGIIGATSGTIFMQKKLDSRTVKKILAVILLLMAVKLIFKIL